MRHDQQEESSDARRTVPRFYKTAEGKARRKHTDNTTHVKRPQEPAGVRRVSHHPIPPAVQTFYLWFLAEAA